MQQNLIYFLPELIVIATIVVLLVTDFLVGTRRKGIYPFLCSLGIVGMLIANASAVGLEPAHFFSGMITHDRMGNFFKTLFGAAGLLGVVLAIRSREMGEIDSPSYYTLLTAVVLGMMLLASSNHLLMIYLSLELVSVLSYVLTGSARGVRRSAEASLKYVIYGGVASGIMVYGMSLLYGITGTMSLPEIAQFLKTHPVSPALLFTSIILMMAGFGYKIAAFPFHMWCPDVYEGAPTPFTAFLSVGPKAAGFAILIRFFLTVLAEPTQGGFQFVTPAGWLGLIMLLSIATMTLGNLAALGQTNLKRLLAYSSIAHAGYMLMGFAAMNEEALSAILFYLVVYLIMNVGAFLVVIVIANQLGVEDLNGYKGLGRRGGTGAYWGLVMAVFLFSLTGIPPMAGFAGKFYLFGAVIRAGLYPLAIIGVLNSVVSLYYYVRVIKVIFFDPPDDPRLVAAPALSQSCVVSVLAGLTLYLGLFWNHLAEIASRSTTLLF